MARKVNKDQIEEIDEILKQEDPEFVKSLDQIDPQALNITVDDLQAAFEAAERSNNFVVRFWLEKSALVRWSVVSGLALVLLGIPGFFVWKYNFSAAASVGDLASLEDIADSSLTFDVSAAPQDLMDHFLIEEILYEIPDHVFFLKPKRGVTFGRFAFYLELRRQEDLKVAEKYNDEIIEVINQVLAKKNVDDFQGIAGKEAVRRTLLSSLNNKMNIKFKSVRYKLIVFN